MSSFLASYVYAWNVITARCHHFMASYVLCIELYHCTKSSFYGILCFMHKMLSLHEVIWWHHMFYAWNIITAWRHHFLASYILCTEGYHCKKSSFYDIVCFMHGTLSLHEDTILWNPTFYAWNFITARGHHFMTSCFMHGTLSLHEDIILWNPTFYVWNILTAWNHHFMASYVLCIESYHCKKSSFYGILCFMLRMLSLLEVIILYFMHRMLSLQKEGYRC